MGSPKSAYERALRLLARRPHFTAELRAKLERKGYSQEEADGAVAELLQKRYLDDLDTARQRVRQRLARGPLGRPRLKADLLRRGASPEVAAAALDELVDEDDRPAARRAAMIWKRSRVPREPERARASLARHLERKGFSRRAIFAVLDEMGSVPAASADSDELSFP